MAIKLSWSAKLALGLVLVISLLALAHAIGFYVQLLAFAIVILAALAFLARRGWRRAGDAWRRRKTPPGAGPRG